MSSVAYKSGDLGGGGGGYRVDNAGATDAGDATQKTTHSYSPSKESVASSKALPLTEPLRNMGLFDAVTELCSGEGACLERPLRVLQCGCGCKDGRWVPETLEVLFYATVPVHLTVLDYNTNSLDVALHCSEYPLPVPPPFKKPGADAQEKYACLDVRRRKALERVMMHTTEEALGDGDAATTAVRYVDRSIFQQTNGHTVDGVCDSFLTHDFGQDEYDLIIGYNSVFYAMNDPDVDEYALLRRILSALKKGSGGDSDGGGGNGGGQFITDYTCGKLVMPLPTQGFQDIVTSTIGKGVRATYVYTRQ